ncbi:hypothetical protein [Lysobacter gummosus]|uniref:hypothetical protein n=1 Tax=Lysobacter gummosus TaxID=262324 RepID=UPI00364035E1
MRDASPEAACARRFFALLCSARQAYGALWPPSRATSEVAVDRRLAQLSASATVFQLPDSSRWPRRHTAWIAGCVRLRRGEGPSL